MAPPLGISTEEPNIRYIMKTMKVESTLLRTLNQILAEK